MGRTGRRAAEPPAAQSIDPRDAVRERIMEATFAVLMDKGYARASTLEIATRAKVSKRELYALFGDKRGILAAMIAARSQRMLKPLAFPEVADRPALAAALARFGASFLKEVCHPTVAALFRLAILEAERSPEVARALDDGGRNAHRIALIGFLDRARKAGLLGDGSAETMAGQFFSLLLGDILLRVVMRAVEAPSAAECTRRSRGATDALLALYPPEPAYLVSRSAAKRGSP